MPDTRKDKYGLTPAAASYQKGGKNYKQGTVNGKAYEGTLYTAAKKKPVKVVESITEATDPNYEYQLAHPYQRNRVMNKGKAK